MTITQVSKETFLSQDAYNCIFSSDVQDIKTVLNHCISLLDISSYTKEKSSFTRRRKLPFKTLIKTVLNMEGNSLNAEIYNNFPNPKERMTASAFVQQRAKLKPEAFKDLLFAFNETFDTAKTLNKLRVYAVDGSDYCTPTNKESKWYIPNHYIRKDGQEAKGTCLLHGNFLYDLLNKQYMDANETRDERAGAIQLIKNIHHPENALVIMDRGYSGFNMIEHCNRYGGYYVIRSPLSGTIKEITELPDEPYDIDIEIRISTKSQQFCDIYGYRKINVHKGKKDDYSEKTNTSQWDFEEKCSVKFRVCKFKINDVDSRKEVWEVLITNLSREEFGLREIKRIYWLRWGIETSFRELKYAVGAINFHSKKDNFILQELYAHLIIFNAASRAAAEIPPLRSKRGYVYAVDFKMVVHIFRCYLRHFNHAPPEEMYADMKCYRHMIKRGEHNARLLKPKSAVYFTYRVA